MLLLGQPSVVQQAYGTHTEGGTQFAAPLVLDAADPARAVGGAGYGSYGGYAGIRSRLGKGGGGGSTEARRLAALCEGLARALHKDDTPAREGVVNELSELLRMTHKGGGVRKRTGGVGKDETERGREGMRNEGMRNEGDQIGE
jgi:hypothetical protein